jgi:hypothetical protein
MFQAIKNFIEEFVGGYNVEEFIVSYESPNGSKKYHIPVTKEQLPYWVKQTMKESYQNFSYQEVEKCGINKYKKVDGWLTTQEDQTLKLHTRIINNVLVR